MVSELRARERQCGWPDQNTLFLLGTLYDAGLTLCVLLIPHPVTVRFQPIQSAPSVQPRVFKISASSRFSVVLSFLRKKLALKDSDGLFLYLHNCFAPGLDEGVGNLFRVSASRL